MTTTSVATPAPTHKAPRTRKPRTKPQRSARLFRYGETAVLVINQQFSATRGQLDTYRLEPIATDYGRGLLLFKEDGSSYSVNLSGHDSTCDCKGFESHGWHEDRQTGELVACKHLGALLKLEAQGQL